MRLGIKIWLLALLLALSNCKDDEEQAATDDTTTNVNNNDNDDNNNGNVTDNPQGLQLTAGLQYTTDSFAAGMLSLYNCGVAQLYRVSANGDPVRADATVKLGNERPTIFIVDAADGCEVRIDNKTYASVHQNIDSNSAAGVARIASSHGLVAAHITKEPSNSSAVRLYISNNAGQDWHKIEMINWQGMNSSTDMVWDAKTHRNNRIMLTSTDDSGNRWWQAITAAFVSDNDGVKLGSAISIAGVGGEDSAQVQLLEDCGLTMFYSYPDTNIGRQTVALLSRQSSAEVPHSDSAAGQITIITAGAPTNMECQPSFIINGIKFTSYLSLVNPQQPDTPALTATTITGDKIKITTPPQPTGFGNLLQLYYYGEERSGNNNLRQWFSIPNPTWGNSYQPSAYAVSTTNKVLFKANYLNNSLWFFVETP